MYHATQFVWELRGILYKHIFLLQKHYNNCWRSNCFKETDLLYAPPPPSSRHSHHISSYPVLSSVYSLFPFLVFLGMVCIFSHLASQVNMCNRMQACLFGYTCIMYVLCTCTYTHTMMFLFAKCICQFFL